MSADELTSTGKEIFESLTGFDEIAVSQRFGRTVIDLASNDASMFGRALVFTAERRDGANDEDAWNAAMSMPMKQVLELAESADVEDADPGKDAPPEEPEQQPASSLSSVS